MYGGFWEPCVLPYEEPIQIRFAVNTEKEYYNILDNKYRIYSQLEPDHSAQMRSIALIK